MQRLSLRGVGYKLMVLEAVSTLTSNVEGEDIVWTAWRHADAGNAAGKALQALLNISWGEYAEFFNDLMLNYVANSTKNVVVLAHGANLDNEDDEIRGKYGVKVKGSIMAKGVESLFNTVIFATTVDIKELKNYKNDMLDITEEEETLGFKHVFQTRVTKQTKRHRIRQPDGMWDISETYIDNDICHVLDRLAEYYDDNEE